MDLGLSKIQLLRNMGNRIFGKPKQTPIVKEAPSLQEQICILEKRKDHLERLVVIYDQKAKASTSKEEAVRNLKLKITYGNEIKTIYGMIYKLEKLEGARNQVKFQKDIYNAAKQTTDIIKQNMVNIDDVNDVMIETEDAMREIDEINQELGRSNSDDETLQAELNNIFAIPEEPSVTVSNIPTLEQKIIMPVAPSETQIEEELRILSTI